MSPEASPFFANRHKRAGLRRRIGNLAAKQPRSLDSDLVAMRILATDETTPREEVAYLKEMMASQLRFVSPLTLDQAKLTARTVEVTVEFANQATYLERPYLVSEEARAVFDDIAALAMRDIE